MPDDRKMGIRGAKDIMKHRRQVLFNGIITAVGISFHNFPEGMAVFIGSMKVTSEPLLAFMLVLSWRWPLHCTTTSQSKWQAFKLASLSGFAESLGVIIPIYSPEPKVLRFLKVCLDQSWWSDDFSNPA
ncbi:hypothetical protein L6164_021803 [Bauhinia variegata]|uniref:Uncharacterized protein n=1 Tax=Bauhinia variegata TaxID=167791 RepID=A0ACB9ME55_BAUVA|nr:hypothetical protein L6164_021803 [Bauhinia variegata]